MKAKERHKCKLLEYLGNPENEFPNRVYIILWGKKLFRPFMTLYDPFFSLSSLRQSKCPIVIIHQVWPMGDRQASF